MKSCLQDNNIEIHSTHNEGKSVVAERFIRTLKNKVYKYLISVPKNVCIDKLNDTVNKYSNTFHSTIKTKPAGVKSSTYIDFNVGKNDKDPKFKANEHVRISKYQNIFAKGYTPNSSEKVLGIKRVKNIAPSTCVVSDLDGEEIVGKFYEKELQETVKQSLELKK